MSLSFASPSSRLPSFSLSRSRYTAQPRSKDDQLDPREVALILRTIQTFFFPVMAGLLGSTINFAVVKLYLIDTRLALKRASTEVSARRLAVLRNAPTPTGEVRDFLIMHDMSLREGFVVPFYAAIGTACLMAIWWASTLLAVPLIHLAGAVSRSTATPRAHHTIH